jgi:hypothetical protein
MKNITKGLALQELEAQHVELLPDRVEMHRRNSHLRRMRRGNNNSSQEAIGVLGGAAVNGTQNSFSV